MSKRMKETMITTTTLSSKRMKVSAITTTFPSKRHNQLKSVEFGIAVATIVNVSVSRTETRTLA